MKLKFLRREKDGRVYVRRHGRSVRLHETPGTDAFFTEYAAALRAEAPVARQPTSRGSFSWLILQFFTAPAFRQLSPAYQRTTRRLLERVAQAHGDKPAERLEARHVRALLADYADRPGAANGLRKALRAVFRWAVTAGHVHSDPTENVERFRYRSIGWHTWTPAEVAQFRERWPTGTTQRLALTLLLYTGARRGDVVLLGPENVQDGWIVFRTQKTGREVAIPILPELAEELRAQNPAVLSGPWLRTAYGKPFTAAGFGMRFRAWANAAGLGHCSAHGLRKAGATLLAERGASEAHLRAIFGWEEGSREPQDYVRAARRRVLAQEGMRLFREHVSVPEDGGGTETEGKA